MSTVFYLQSERGSWNEEYIRSAYVPWIKVTSLGGGFTELRVQMELAYALVAKGSSLFLLGNFSAFFLGIDSDSRQ